MKQRFSIITSALLILLIFSSSGLSDRGIVRPGSNEKRHALVIGNGAYKTGRLQNAPNDAQDMAEALKTLRFKVEILTNAGQRDMEKAIRDFGNHLKQGGVGLFYFAGHGMQVKSRNYLIPVDAKIETESDVEYESVDAGRVLGKMEDAGNELNIVILDACRNNPFARSFRNSKTGLAQMDAPIGTLIAYSTSPGSIAEDGMGRNSTFTNYLIKYMKTPGLPFEMVFKSVREKVVRLTNRKQVPWVMSSVIGNFYFAVGSSMEIDMPKPSAEQLMPKYSDLTVRANVYGAIVWFDDIKMGTTPIKITKISAGEYLVKVSASGYKTYKHRLELKPGRSEELTALLENYSKQQVPEKDNTVVQSAIQLSASDAIPRPIWPSISIGRKYRWKMVTTWPAGMPFLQTNCERFAKLVEDKSKGRLKIQVFSSGELVKPLSVFDAVSDGTAQVGSGASYYWSAKVPAAQWFAGVPFGMNAYGMAKWIHSEGGQELWEEVYEPFNVIPRPAGNIGMQMGGWFRKQINTLNDFKMLKMRIPGLGGKVLAKAGATIVLMPGNEIFTSLEKGVIDAIEWVGPFLDRRMGFYKAAKYYYYPGWQEPGTMLELIFNRKAYFSLPSELQALLDQCALECERRCDAEFNQENMQALEYLVNHNKVDLKKFPDSVIRDLKKLSEKVMYNESLKDAMSKKVYNRYRIVQQKLGESASTLEYNYYKKYLK